MLEPLVGFGRLWIEHSWSVAAVVVKYILALILIRILYDDFSVERFEEEIVDTSRYVVYGIAAAGLVSASLGMNFQVSLPIFSQVVALVYFGYLFWVY